MKSGDQSIGWHIEIDFEYSDTDTEYTMGLREMEQFGFSKSGPTHIFNGGAVAYYHTYFQKRS